MNRQVDSSHYAFSAYMDKKRWVSVWHQLDELTRMQSAKTLEIGPGLGLLKAAAAVHGLKVETLDIDPDLAPDHLGSVFAMPFRDGEYDAVCAFQMLEHLPYQDALRAVGEMGRVAAKGVIVSLPEAQRRYPIQLTAPRLGLLTWHIRRPYLRPIPSAFDGQHYWEVGQSGFAVDRIAADFGAASGLKLERQYLVPENPRHRFFVYRC